MQRFRKSKGVEGSSIPSGSHKKRMSKPRIYTTKNGTQYVHISDVVGSEAGWAEIQKLKEANLVRRTESSESEQGKSHPPHDKGDNS
jgi:hypothetical protein